MPAALLQAGQHGCSQSPSHCAPAMASTVMRCCCYCRSATATWTPGRPAGGSRRRGERLWQWRCWLMGGVSALADGSGGGMWHWGFGMSHRFGCSQLGWQAQLFTSTAPCPSFPSRLNVQQPAGHGAAGWRRSCGGRADLRRAQQGGGDWQEEGGGGASWQEWQGGGSQEEVSSPGLLGRADTLH